MSKTLEVVNPYSLKCIGNVETSEWEQVDVFLETAHNLFRQRDEWLPAFQRIAILKKTAQLIEARFDELAFQIANEVASHWLMPVWKLCAPLMVWNFACTRLAK